MALIRCPECRKKISDTASQCTNCGRRITAEEVASIKEQEERRKNGCAIGCLSVFVLFMVIMIIASLTSDSPSSSSRGIVATDYTPSQQLAIIDGGLYMGSDDTSLRPYRRAMAGIDLKYEEDLQAIANMILAAKQRLEQRGIKVSNLELLETLNEVAPDALITEDVKLSAVEMMAFILVAFEHRGKL